MTNTTNAKGKAQENRCERWLHCKKI